MKLKLLSTHHVAPKPLLSSPGLWPSPLLPLTYFDLFWYPLKPMKFVFFYPAPGLSISDFLRIHIPALENGLSLTLHRFLPLAGRLIRHAPIQGGDTVAQELPCLCYSHGDSVQLTVVQASGDKFQFHTLTADEPKPASLLRRLVPPLASAAAPSPEQSQSVLAIQVTLFPSQGISLGISYLHVVMDGSTMSLFMRTWSTICRCGDTKSIEEPSFDRIVIEEPDQALARGLMEFAERNMADGSVEAMDLSPNPDVLRTTVRLTSSDVENLRQRVCSDNSCPRYSSFALATALIWTTVLKSRTIGFVFPADANMKEWFVFVCDLRSRLGVPETYFGNLLGSCVVGADRAELKGSNGFTVAASLVRDVARTLQQPEGVRRAAQVTAEGMLVKLAPFSVAGSPRLGLYATDFGWGRPIKIEVASIESTGAMSLSESPDDDEGGLEIGVVLGAEEMDAFVALFDNALHRPEPATSQIPCPSPPYLGS